MVAISFVRSAHDVRRLGTEPHPRGPLVVAKIETRSAVDNLAGILDAAGAVMIARGDLGIECPIEELPHLQKHIIRECIAHGRPAITATQMLESMVRAATPTRAEASDVANAVFDGSSAVMLSGETATGSDPVNVIATMARLCARADANFDVENWTRMVTPPARRGSAQRRRPQPAGHRHHDRRGLARGPGARGEGDPLPHPDRLHRPRDRALPAAHADPRLHPRRARAPAAVDQLGRDADHALRLRRQRGDGARGGPGARDLGHVRTGDIVVVLAGIDGRSRTTAVR